MEGYGLANIASKEAITACTRFDLASVSKTFTSTAVLILQERGQLSIDDDVRKYIPELPQYPNGPLRLRDLLQHVSGLTDYLELPSVPKSNKSYWVLCHEYRRSKRRCATVREMKGGPSRSAIRC